ncbi:hypothetical protein C0991_004564 [Blastosporella zonata]|nr:hypothetical protein C0991_004564 [Blastosporella zonata]
MTTDRPDSSLPVHSLEYVAWRSDYLLSDVLEKELHGLLDGLAEVVNQYDSKIAKVQATLAQLLNERERYAQRIDKLKSAVAPHKRLPPEILSKIFSECSSSPLHIPPKLVHSMHDDIPPIFSLPTSVCSRWRQIAVNSRDLWDNLIVTYPAYRSILPWIDKTEEISSVAKRVISRGTRSLTVRVLALPKAPDLPQEVEPLRNLVIPFFQQLTHITIMCAVPHLYDFLRSSSPSFPALECLTFRGEEDPMPHYEPRNVSELTMFETCPNLRSFRIDLLYLNFMHSLSQNALRVPWGQLTELLLSSTWVGVGTAHSIISRCTSLVSCRFSLLFFNEETLDLTFPLPSIVHPRLQTLTISSTSGSPSVAARFLQSLVLPSLRSFTITDKYVDESLPSFIAFITRSECPLRTFSASSAQIPAILLDPLLELVSGLEHLDIPKAIISIPMLERMAQGAVLPKLVKVDCTINCSPRSLEVFMDAVERIGAEMGATPLQVASARYPLTERHYRAPRWPQANQRFKGLYEKLQREGRSISLKD